MLQSLEQYMVYVVFFEYWDKCARIFSAKRPCAVQHVQTEDR